MGDEPHFFRLDIGDDVDPFDVQKLLEREFGGQVAIDQVHCEGFFRRECARRVQELGPTLVLAQAGFLAEALLERGESSSVLAKVVNGMLKQCKSMPKELVIIDPYLFPKNPHVDYGDIVDQIWADVLDHTSKLTVVTRKKFDAGAKAVVAAKVKTRKSSLVMTHHQSNDYHDRFWILDRLSAVFVGTSINGLGNKYALADFMKPADVQALVRALDADGFL